MEEKNSLNKNLLSLFMKKKVARDQIKYLIYYFRIILNHQYVQNFFINLSNTPGF